MEKKANMCKKSILSIFIALLLFIPVSSQAFGQTKKPAKPEAKAAKTVNAAKTEKADKTAKADDKAQCGEIYQKAQAFLSKGEDDKALPLLNKCVQLDQTLEGAWLGLGSVYVKKGKCDNALAVYQKALKCIPNSASLWFNYGVAQADDPGDSIKSFEHAIKIDPDHAKAWKYKGYALAKLTRFKEACPCFEKALSITPGDSRAMLFLGISNHMSGNEGEGKKQINNALAKNPSLKGEIPPELQKELGL